MGNDGDYEELAREAGKMGGDMTFPLVYTPELHFCEFESAVADMKNSVKDRNNAQSSCAGLFIYRHLKHAGHQGRWVHVDMYYPSFLGEYATGYGVGLLCAHMGVI